ncbi:hypothetical protein ACFE04_023696 [Oxalis oulophora]
MHGRHRSPGNGYRSNFSGMGMGGSRVSSEDSTRGHGFYNSEYRSFNRGFGRGQGQGQMKSYQPPPPVPTSRKGGAGGGGGDVFMEAGRLAAEYLVSQGFLPPSALSGKWQNGNAKGSFRFQDSEEGRSSPLSRLGNSSSDGKRKYPDYMKGKRKGGSFREDLREYGKSSWSDRARDSPDMYGDDSIAPEQYEEQLSDKNGGNGSEVSGSDEPVSKIEETVHAEVELVKRQSSEDLVSKASSSDSVKNQNPSHGTDGECSKKIDDSKNKIEVTPEMKFGCNDMEIEKQDDPSSNNGTDTDLTTLCKFENLPTKTRSSVTSMASKVDSLPNNDEETNPDSVSQNNIEDMAEDNSDRLSSVSNKALDSKLFSNSEISEPVPAQSAENVEELGSKYGLERGQWMRSQSFPNIGLMDNDKQELGQSLAPLQRSSTMVKVRGGKRAIEDNNTREEIKKPREWLQRSVSEPGELIQPIKLTDDQQEETISSVEKVTVAVPPNGSVNNPQFAAFPTSFKICDLNLMEGSDVNENHHSHMMLIEQSISETKREPIDLSISNSKISGEHRSMMSTGKAIEIIDLENDSNDEEKPIEKRTETMFTNLDGFSNNAQNRGPISDVEDHYDGLMITEYLDAFSNSPTTQDDLNPLQNEIGLPHGEGTLVDDDAIYMSLGEIPLSFMPPWENPQPREYKKPF